MLCAVMSDSDDQVPATVRAAMEACGLDYEIMECDPELADTATFCAHYGHAMEDSANAILVKSKTGEEKFVACVLLATTRLDVNKVVRKKMGARKVSFADPEETKRITGMELGGVTPPGLPADLPLWVDARVMERPFVILGAGTRSAKIKVSPDYFLKLPQTEVVEGLAKDVG
jgi:prolyl-tRNA editing enzyme YbaK/EbsC (Cys-tRNA(Pro) deacylase)